MAGAVPLIDVRPTEAGLEIVGRVTALESGSIDGELIIQRTGAAGSVSTRQGTSVQLEAGQSADIARVGVSHSPGDALSVELILSRGGVTIARSEFTTSPNQ